MTKITNKTPHPYDIHTKDGVKVISAFGTLDAEFEPAYLELIKLSFDVEETGVSSNEQVDADGGDSGADGSGEVPGETEGQRPEAEYESLAGKKPDGRWNEERLQAEIAKLKG